ncbi:hypothetical protein MTO96_041810 [Rhipicephalus appendiculatus]
MQDGQLYCPRRQPTCQKPTNREFRCSSYRRHSSPTPDVSSRRWEILVGVLTLIVIVLGIALGGVLAFGQCSDSVSANCPTPTIVTPEKPKMPIICTFGRLLGQPATLPEEGLCDYAFYEFHYQPYGSPDFLNPNHALLQRYMDATRLRRKTQYGLGFIPFDLGDFQYQLTLVKVNALFKIFWDARIYHYGMLTIAHVTTASDLVLILKILQNLKQLATLNGQGVPKTLTVLGLTVFSDQDFDLAATTITHEAKPDIIISYGHLIFERHAYDHCKILGPTNMKLGQSPPGYAYDLRHPHEIAVKLSKMNFNSVLYISVSLRGFRYKPKANDAAGSMLFAACEDFAGQDMLDKSTDYSYLCDKHLRKGNVSVNEDAQIVLVIDAMTSDVITYDNEDTLRSKLCTVKGNYTKLYYGIAVYDVDHDDFANNCVGQSRYESYSRPEDGQQA